MTRLTHSRRLIHICSSNLPQALLKSHATPRDSKTGRHILKSYYQETARNGLKGMDTLLGAVLENLV